MCGAAALNTSERVVQIILLAYRLESSWGDIPSHSAQTSQANSLNSGPFLPL
jgi:hypothetical protein